MQDLASDFSKIFRGNTTGPSQREGATPCRTQHPAQHFAQAPRCWDPNLAPLNFSAVVATLGIMLIELPVSTPTLVTQKVQGRSR